MVYRCIHCGELIEFDADEFDCGGSYHPDGEEMLWAHIQFDHPDIFETDQVLETPDMIEYHYELKEE